jgi:hypothetical protein
MSTMAEDSSHSIDSEVEKETMLRPLTIWDNTPEVEQREIEAFMEWACADLEASLPPYDWGDEHLK